MTPETHHRTGGARVLDHSNVHATDTIAHVYTVHISNAECYYLKMLLHVKYNKTDCKELKVVE